MTEISTEIFMFGFLAVFTGIVVYFTDLNQNSDIIPTETQEENGSSEHSESLVENEILTDVHAQTKSAREEAIRRAKEEIKLRPPISPENECSMDRKEADAEEDEMFSWLTIDEPNPVLTKIIKCIKVGQEYALPVIRQIASWILGLPPE